MMPWLAGRWGKSIACLDFSKVFDTASLKILRGWMRRWDANWLTGWWRSVAQSYLLIRTKNLQQCTCAFICLCILPFLSFHDYQLCGFMNLQQQRYLPLQSFISYCLRFLYVKEHTRCCISLCLWEAKEGLHFIWLRSDHILKNTATVSCKLFLFLSNAIILSQKSGLSTSKYLISWRSDIVGIISNIYLKLFF